MFGRTLLGHKFKLSEWSLVSWSSYCSPEIVWSVLLRHWKHSKFGYRRISEYNVLWPGIVWSVQCVACRVDIWWIIWFPSGSKDFFKASKSALGPTQPPAQWVPRYLSMGVKQQGHEADQSLPSWAKAEDEWSYTSFPPICLHGMHRDNFTFTLTLMLYYKLCIILAVWCTLTPFFMELHKYSYFKNLLMNWENYGGWYEDKCQLLLIFISRNLKKFCPFLSLYHISF